MLTPGRHASDESYRYGFQGQEKDDQLKGEGNSLNYKYRMHDPRIGRFFAVDPLAPKYPWNSPYTFSENKITIFTELEGLEISVPTWFRPTIRYSIPRLSLPRITVPEIPVQPIYPIPPVAIPHIHTPTLPQTPPTVPIIPINRAQEFDWEGIDMGDTGTWPEVPPMEGQEELSEVEPLREKAKELGQKRLKDEKGRIYRPHKPDEHHPKGHWDIKDPEKFGPWRNYTPNGTEISKGMRWGIDWELPVFIGPIPVPNEDLKTWKEYLKKLEQYQKDMEIYKKKMKEYKVKKAEYDKAMKEYWDSIPDEFKA